MKLTSIKHYYLFGFYNARMDYNPYYGSSVHVMRSLIQFNTIIDKHK